MENPEIGGTDSEMGLRFKEIIGNDEDIVCGNAKKQGCDWSFFNPASVLFFLVFLILFAVTLFSEEPKNNKNQSDAITIRNDSRATVWCDGKVVLVAEIGQAKNFMGIYCKYDSWNDLRKDLKTTNNFGIICYEASDTAFGLREPKEMMSWYTLISLNSTTQCSGKLVYIHGIYKRYYKDIDVVYQKPRTTEVSGSWISPSPGDIYLIKKGIARKI